MTPTPFGKQFEDETTISGFHPLIKNSTLGCFFIRVRLLKSKNVFYTVSDLLLGESFQIQFSAISSFEYKGNSNRFCSRKTRREDDGGRRRAHCRNAHVLHCLLKFILFADLLPFLELGSIPNSQTNNPNSERRKNWSKPWNNQKNKNSFTPCHLSSFSSDPLHGSKLFVVLFFDFLKVSATLAQECPKWKNQINKKNKKFHHMSPVQFLLGPSPCVETYFVSSRILPPWPKNAPKPMEKNK